VARGFFGTRQFHASQPCHFLAQGIAWHHEMARRRHAISWHNACCLVPRNGKAVRRCIVPQNGVASSYSLTISWHERTTPFRGTTPRSLAISWNKAVAIFWHETTPRHFVARRLAALPFPGTRRHEALAIFWHEMTPFHFVARRLVSTTKWV